MHVFTIVILVVTIILLAVFATNLSKQARHFSRTGGHTDDDYVFGSVVAGYFGAALMSSLILLYAYPFNLTVPDTIFAFALTAFGMAFVALLICILFSDN